MNKTPIEWTDYTWNPVRARLKGQGPKVRSGTFCTRISPGCTNCYASTINRRFGTGMAYTVPNLDEHEFFIDERILAEPLKLRKPSRIFVGDMFDLFHEAIPKEMLDRVFAVIAHCSQTWNRCRAKDCDHCSCPEGSLERHEPHTFQVLTKRAARMHAYFSDDTKRELHERLMRAWDLGGWWFENPPITDAVFPLPNLWLGVSVEDQQRADERIPFLERTPAAIRFLSVEPMLEEIWIEPHLLGQTSCGRSDWVICGGQSGPGARPFNLAWAESLLAQCRAAGVPFFMKQLGSKPFLRREQGPTETKLPGGSMRFASLVYESTIPLRDRKGGDPTEWPEHLRVREFPASQKAEAVPA